jgi:hypothetical protein
MSDGGRLAFIACFLSTVAAGPAGTQAARDTLDVLFVGNSYVYFNDLPALLDSMSASLDGPLIRTEAHTHGGTTLRRHIESGHVAEMLEDGAPNGMTWDRVILQGQSALGTPLADAESGTLGDSGDFLAAIRELAVLIEEAGSEPVLYMTWPTTCRYSFLRARLVRRS